MLPPGVITRQANSAFDFAPRRQVGQPLPDSRLFVFAAAAPPLRHGDSAVKPIARRSARRRLYRECFSARCRYSADVMMPPCRYHALRVGLLRTHGTSRLLLDALPRQLERLTYELVSALYRSAALHHHGQMISVITRLALCYVGKYALRPAVTTMQPPILPAAISLPRHMPGDEAA